MTAEAATAATPPAGCADPAPAAPALAAGQVAGDVGTGARVARCPAGGR